MYFSDIIKLGVMTKTDLFYTVINNSHSKLNLEIQLENSKSGIKMTNMLMDFIKLFNTSLLCPS